MYQRFFRRLSAQWQKIISVSLLAVAGCSSPQPHDTEALTKRVDSLQQLLAATYRPGFGEFMSSIQVHHAKLWFAGQAQNWKLASFEIDEIKEALEDIRQYNKDRVEVKSLPMIDPALDSITLAIKQGNIQSFKASFVLLTNTCNNCHRATNHEFNVIKIPASEPFTNQEFKAQ